MLSFVCRTTKNKFFNNIKQWCSEKSYGNFGFYARCALCCHICAIIPVAYYNIGHALTCPATNVDIGRRHHFFAGAALTKSEVG